MNVIITGSTGMVGKGVLYECLGNNEIDKVLVINRKPLGIKHQKLKEIILNDFFNINKIKKDLEEYDACFFCLGVSTLGLSEEKYTHITYELAKKIANVLFELNPNMVFNYVSGTGTDSTEKGIIMWARVKGKTENLILNMKFKDAYMFRPGAIIPLKGIKSGTKFYQFIITLFRPIFPLLIRMKSVTTTEKIGNAMINSVLNPQSLKYLENKDINELANN